jgi:predicted enzyme related to lactoylglutathione lyase
MNTKKLHALNWFEIHAANLQRAKRFYETILQISMEEVKVGDMPEVLFSFDRTQGGGGGSILESNTPPSGGGGTLICLNVEGDLEGVLSRISSAGGTVTKPRTAIGPYGFIGIFKDTKGNRIGLHSRTSRVKSID